MNEIRPISIDPDRLAGYCAIMVAGNSKLKDCANLAGMKHREFRRQLIKADMRPSDMDVPTKVILAVNQALPDIKAVQSIEEPMFNGNVRIAWTLAKRISRWSSLEYDDCEQEAYSALVDAIYGFSDPAWQFTSFAWHACRRRLLAAHNRNSRLSPPSNHVVDLMARYERKKQALNCEGPVTELQVIENMGVVEADRCMIQDYLAAAKLCSGSGLDPEADEPLDYTAFRKGIDHESTAAVVENFEVYDAMDRANLTAFERKVVMISMNSHYGWQSELAAETINPKTNKPYTRRAIAVILDRALSKIRHAYEYRMAG